MKYIKVKTAGYNAQTVYINTDHIDCVIEEDENAIIKLNGGDNRTYKTIESAEMVMRLIEMVHAD